MLRSSVNLKGLDSYVNYVKSFLLCCKKKKGVIT